MEKIKLKSNSLQLLLLSSFLLSQLFFANSDAGILFKREINYDNSIRNSSNLSNNKTTSESISLNNSQPTTDSQQSPKSTDTTIIATKITTPIAITESLKQSSNKDKAPTIASATDVGGKNAVETTTELLSIFGKNSLFSHMNSSMHNNSYDSKNELEKAFESISTIAPLTTTEAVLVDLSNRKDSLIEERLQDQSTTIIPADTTTDMFSFDYSKYLEPFNNHESNISHYDNDVHSTSPTRDLDFDERHKEITHGFGDDIEFKSFPDFDLSKPTVVSEHSSEAMEKIDRNKTSEKNSTVYLNNLEIVETKYDQSANAVKTSNHSDHQDSSEILGSKEVVGGVTEKKAKFLDPSKDLRLHYPVDSVDVLNLGETYVIKRDQLNTTQMTPTNAIDGLWAFASMMQGENSHNKTGVYRNETSIADSSGANTTVKALADWMEIIKNVEFANTTTTNVVADTLNGTNQTNLHEDIHSSENRIAVTSILNSTAQNDKINGTKPTITDIPVTKFYEKNTLPTDESFVKTNKIPSTNPSKYEVRETPDESVKVSTTTGLPVKISEETTIATNDLTTSGSASTTKPEVTSMLDETTTEIGSTTSESKISMNTASTMLPISNNEIHSQTTTMAAPVTSTLSVRGRGKTTSQQQSNPTTDSNDPALNELTPKTTTLKATTTSSMPEKLEVAASTLHPSYIDIRSATTTTTTAKTTPIDSTLEINTIDKSTESIKQKDRNVVNINPKTNGEEYKYNTVEGHNSGESTSSRIIEPRITDINEHTDDFSDLSPTTPLEPTSPPILEGNQQSSSDDTDVNAIIAITVSIIGFIALLLLIGFLFIMRKRQKQLTYGQRCRPVSLDDYNLDNVSIYNSVRRKANLRMSKRSYGNSAFEDPALRSNLLTIPSLATFVQSKHSIHEEFKEIPQINARADEVPAGCEDKNRYANVIPLPETRVHLSRQDNDEKTEYINANFVKGPKDSTNYYIATQAPMENTITDFWRMIWEHNSKVIVMATDLTENGVEKCAEYLPPSVVLDNSRTFGDYQVTLKNREVKEKYAISTIHLRNEQTKTWREIVHFWYQWPDQSAPVDETSMIAMLLEARSHLKLALPEQTDNEDANKKDSNKISDGTDLTISKKDVEDHEENAKDNNKEKDEEQVNEKEESAKEKESKQTNTSDSKVNHYSIISNGSYDKHKSLQRMQGPLTVHCSPGTGRTGTIIACDIALRILEIPPRQIDVPQIVYYVRRGRASAVRTREQYEFIYRVANVYATKLTGPSLEN